MTAVPQARRPGFRNRHRGSELDETGTTSTETWLQKPPRRVGLDDAMTWNGRYGERKNSVMMMMMTDDLKTMKMAECLILTTMTVTKKTMWMMKFEGKERPPSS